MLFKRFSDKNLEHTNKSLQRDLSKEQLAHVTEKTQHEALQQRLEDRNQEISRLNTQMDQAQRKQAVEKVS